MIILKEEAVMPFYETVGFKRKPTWARLARYYKRKYPGAFGIPEFSFSLCGKGSFYGKQHSMKTTIFEGDIQLADMIDLRKQLKKRILMTGEKEL
ncbi:hypothetical protein AALB16_00660 [Lachnospiraceae bacterium 62-35]